MQIYLVGGAVRDKLLNYSSDENDWVVVGASEKDMLKQGFSSVGKDFPVFLHPDTKEEYALARKERKTAAGYAGFAFDTNQSVTLEEDLLRRDLTINAIAEKSEGHYVDPFGGCDDIKNKVLRHVSEAFAEDPVRILRVARFAARYHHLGFSIAKDTMALMCDMVKSGEVDSLVAERVWKEFEKALTEQNPEIFIRTLRDCGALKVIMPEINALFGVPQPTKHHPEIDTGIHSLMVLEQACLLSKDKAVRFASLCHDLGKALTAQSQWPKHHGHEKTGLPALITLCERLKVPNEFRELAALAMEYHTHVHRAYELKASTLLKLFKNSDSFRRPERFAQFLLCCKADARGRTGFQNNNYTQGNYVAYALESIRDIKAQQFVEMGLKGKEIGEAIDKERLNRLSELVKVCKEETIR